MNINVNTVLVDFASEPLTQPVKGPKDGDGNDTIIQEEITLKMVTVNALLAEDPKNPLTGVKKIEMYDLAKKVYDADGEITLKSEEVTLLKERVLAGYATIIAGQVVKLLGE